MSTFEHLRSHNDSLRLSSPDIRSNNCCFVAFRAVQLDATRSHWPCSEASRLSAVGMNWEEFSANPDFLLQFIGPEEEGCLAQSTPCMILATVKPCSLATLSISFRQCDVANHFWRSLDRSYFEDAELQWFFLMRSDLWCDCLQSCHGSGYQTISLRFWCLGRTWYNMARQYVVCIAAGSSCIGLEVGETGRCEV